MQTGAYLDVFIPLCLYMPEPWSISKYLSQRQEVSKGEEGGCVQLHCMIYTISQPQKEVIGKN